MLATTPPHVGSVSPAVLDQVTLPVQRWTRTETWSSAPLPDARRALGMVPALQCRRCELRPLHELSYDKIAVDLDTTPTSMRGLRARGRLFTASELARWR